MACPLVNLVLLGGDVHANEGDGAAAAAGGSFEAGNDFAVLKASEEARCRGSQKRQKQTFSGTMKARS